MTRALSLLLILVLPLLGVLLAGRSPEHYLEFPPTTRLVVHEPFSWPLFLALAGLIVLATAPILIRVLDPNRGRFMNMQSCPRLVHQSCRVFPWWGWAALGWTALWWFFAWSRFEWLRAFQTLTFTPLWLGYIMIVNALTFRLTRRCMMLHRPLYFLSLFPLSAGFWWLFEYLNRYVQNWFYFGGGPLSAWEYVLQATLPFSTVLPAVLGTAELLSAYPRLTGGLDHFIEFSVTPHRIVGWGLLVVACGGLLGIGLWSNYLFPLVWVTPLLVITALEWIRGEPTIFSRLRYGDWRVLWQAAIAALVCGFFWELWNVHSLAHWEYAIPFVHRFQLFEMPILGYAGYLPFGLECLAVADLFLPWQFAGGVEYYRTDESGIALAQRNPTVAAR
jgi:hypothetical protein